jgi:UDP-N-acetylglucosamine 2-epimerase
MLITTIVDACPQGVKPEMVSSALRAEGLKEQLIEPDLGALNAVSPTHQIAALLRQIECGLVTKKSDATLIYGETNAAFAGALASAKLCIPVIWLEAGFDSAHHTVREKRNRMLIALISNLRVTSETEAEQIAKTIREWFLVCHPRVSGVPPFGAPNDVDSHFRGNDEKKKTKKLA